MIEIKPEDNTKVSPDDRAALRRWLDDPITRRALALVESQRPSIIRAGSGSTVEERRYARELRLTQLQGWESYRNALLNLRFTPEQVRQVIEETYSDEQ